MTRFRFADEGEPLSTVSLVMTRLFDLLLVGGYVACLILTYMLAANSGGPLPDLPEAIGLPAETGEATPGAAASPTPAEPEEGQDLVAAMNAYIALINEKKYGDAMRMRADDNVPSLERIKQTQRMELQSVQVYPRIKREAGSIFVQLAITKAEGVVKWKGRIDWELRGTRWVTVKWDSGAEPPAAAPAAAATSAAGSTPVATPIPASTPLAATPAVAPTPEKKTPTPNDLPTSFEFPSGQ